MVDDVSGAQLVSRLIKRWSDENKVEINYKKCGIMELKSNQVEEQPAKDSDQLWERFPKVNNYKYLGITLNQSLLPKQHLEHLQNKLKKFKKMVIIIRLQGAPGHQPNVLVDRICGINLQLRILHLRSRGHDSRGH